MGNSQTKEARGQAGPGSRGSAPASPTSPVDGQQSSGDATNRPTLSGRQRRSSRPDLSFLGIGGSTEQDVSSLEARRENKAERDARRLEKEKAARLKERERSMREEHVDGGYLVTQGVYVGTEDFNKAVVRQLMIERRLAPFWRGLNDFSENWAEHQLMAAARGISIPPADQVPPELEYRLSKRPSSDNDKERSRGLTIPTIGKPQFFQSENTAFPGSLPLPSPTGPSSSSLPFRTRAKTLASLTTSSRSNSQTDMTPREFKLPHDPFVNGQPIEAYLYKDASECPICFLYYPPYLNTTRCCEQPICSECFVQIKRPDPHPPEHETPDPNTPILPEEERQARAADGELVSEVATCPYCKTPEFGITYTPPPFRRGLTYALGSQPYQIVSATTSQTSISSGGLSPGRRRGMSLSATAPEVITTDKVRPDWATKLATARAHAARRSAAATALHTAAYLMNGQQDTARFGAFGRRHAARRSEGGPGSPLSALALLAERTAARQEAEGRGSHFLPPPRGSSSRRTRIDDLEDMMMMEAIRLSLASEEERRKREDKEAKKKAKKEEKENRKAEKAARKTSLFTLNSNGSGSDADISVRGRAPSIHSSVDVDETVGKGKGVELNDNQSADLLAGEETIRFPVMSLSGTSQESLAPSVPIPSGAFRRSHLRQMSNASSTSSSFQEPAGSSFPGSSTPPAEPMFNFRSLAAMIGEDEKDKESHVEDADGHVRHGSFEEIDDRAVASALGSTHERVNGQQQPSESVRGNGHVQKMPAHIYTTKEPNSSAA